MAAVNAIKSKSEEVRLLTKDEADHLFDLMVENLNLRTTGFESEEELNAWHFYFFNDQLRNFPTFCSRNDRARGDVAPSRKPLICRSPNNSVLVPSARHIPGHRAGGADRWSNELTKIFPSLHANRKRRSNRRDVKNVFPCRLTNETFS